MFNQKDLFGGILEEPQTKEDLNKVCCESCYTAQEEKCVCKCHGAYHGLGNHNLPKEGTSEDFPLSNEQAKPFLDQIKDKKCRWCGAKFDETIMAYGPHSGGWLVEEYDEPLWLFIPCPKCHYEWSIWKLGVARERF